MVAFAVLLMFFVVVAMVIIMVMIVIRVRGDFGIDIPRATTSSKYRSILVTVFVDICSICLHTFILRLWLLAINMARSN